MPDDLLAQVLEAARLAPTAANRQPFRLIVLHTAGRQEELRRLYHREWFGSAPLVIGVCAVAAEAWVRRDGVNYAFVDAAIVMDHIVLAATELGWAHAGSPRSIPPPRARSWACRKGSSRSRSRRSAISDDTPRVKERKPLAELVRWERW